MSQFTEIAASNAKKIFSSTNHNDGLFCRTHKRRCWLLRLVCFNPSYVVFCRWLVSPVTWIVCVVSRWSCGLRYQRNRISYSTLCYKSCHNLLGTVKMGDIWDCVCEIRKFAEGLFFCLFFYLRLSKAEMCLFSLTETLLASGKTLLIYFLLSLTVTMVIEIMGEFEYWQSSK